MKRFNLYMTVFVVLFTLSTFAISMADTGSTCSGGAITIPNTAYNLGAADPYPSEIVVSGLAGSIEEVTVTLNGLYHTYPDDIGIMLVGPEGQSLILMSGAGGNSDIDVDLTFKDDDDANGYDALSTAAIISGTYNPSNVDGNAGLPSAPALSDTTLAAFDGTDPNGAWRLYVYDYAGGDDGTLDGWCITITTDGVDDSEGAPDAVVDSDGDGVCDDDEACLATPMGAAVDEYGCSAEQLVDEACPCDFAWKNHGEYVSCVAHAAQEQYADGLITFEEKCAVVAERAKETCGKKK